MPNLVLTCPSCGQKISPSVGECLYCPPPVSAGPSRSPNPFSPHPTETPASTAEPTAAQLLLVAEECLVRAQPDKAADLAGRALHLRPDSLEAKALLDRARRQLARQRRRGRQEERLKEAERLLDAGDLAGAETVAGSVLTRVPGHPEALALFGRVKGRRLAKGDAEAEAEQDLARLAQGQARRAAESARAARGAGWDRKAMLALGRGLRVVPDDPELIGLWQETQRALGEQERARSRRRAADGQVRAALDLMKEGRLDESLEALRSLLRQDPDHPRAQAAIQEVRQAWVARSARSTPAAPAAPVTPAATVARAPAPAAPVAPVPVPPRPTSASAAEPRPIAPPPPPVPPPPAASRPSLLGPDEMRRRAAIGASIVPPAPAAPPPPAPAASSRVTPVPFVPAPPARPPLARAAAPPPEVALRRSRKGTPLLLVLGSAALMAGVLLVLTSRPGGRVTPAARATAAPPPPTRVAVPETPPPAGPLAGADPEVRQAVETTLAAYARALESQDAQLLARARPDLAPAERERLLAPFRGAINVATDLRVLDVIPRRGLVIVPVLRTDVIVGGRGAPTAPVEETLRFEQRDGAWRLAAR